MPKDRICRDCNLAQETHPHHLVQGGKWHRLPQCPPVVCSLMLCSKQNCVHQGAITQPRKFHCQKGASACEKTPSTRRSQQSRRPPGGGPWGLHSRWSAGGTCRWPGSAPKTRHRLALPDVGASGGTTALPCELPPVINAHCHASSPVGEFSMVVTTSKPSSTSPNTVCRPSSLEREGGCKERLQKARWVHIAQAAWRTSIGLIHDGNSTPSVARCCASTPCTPLFMGASVQPARCACGADPPGGGDRSYKKLAAVGVGARVGHGQQAGHLVLELEVLVGEGAACPVGM